MKASRNIFVRMLVVAFFCAALPAQAQGSVVARLSPGGAAFWRGGIRPAVAYEYSQTGTVFSTLYNYQQYYRDYEVAVRRGGHLLRVAVDHPSYRDYFGVSLLDPTGEESEQSYGYMTAESYVDAPAEGTWTVRVWTDQPDNANFRVRAALQKKPAAPPRNAKALLPNLRLVPPFEFTFNSPYDGYFEGAFGRVPRVTPPDRYNRSCTADDVAEHAARRCLRFSLGPANTGVGPFQLRFGGPGLDGVVYQRIYDTKGNFTEREAGRYEYHKTHMHYHHTGFGSLDLFKITDAKRGTMVKAGVGPKQGFCTADVVMVGFERVTQAPKDSTQSTCVNDMTPIGTFSPTGTLMGVSPGWADIYGWSQDGNYIEFGDNADGLYVVRSTADAAGFVRESNEKDNTSYALIRVTGNTIKVLERGHGQSPWDRRKELARDILNLTPVGYE